MDFSLSEEQAAVSELAALILADLATPERLAEIESSTWFDAEGWRALAEAGLVGISVPATLGGGGLGFLDVCVLLTEHGRAPTPMPLWCTLVAAHLIARHGTDELAASVLPSVVDGSAIITVAAQELATGDLAVVASDVSDGYSLTGVSDLVPWAECATHMVVAFRRDNQTALALVDSSSPGVSLARRDTFNRQPDCTVHFDDVVVANDAIFDGDGVAAWFLDRATVAVCAVASGVADRATRLTAEYASERKQFDRPIATFQAVGQRMADAYIAAEAIRLSMLGAASALDAGLACSDLVDIAKYWASEAGSQVGHTGLHVHGGISIDLDYPIHRYFLWAKQIELTLGSGTPRLASLGKSLASEALADRHFPTEGTTWNSPM